MDTCMEHQSQSIIFRMEFISNIYRTDDEIFFIFSIKKLTKTKWAKLCSATSPSSSSWLIRGQINWKHMLHVKILFIIFKAFQAGVTFAGRSWKWPANGQWSRGPSIGWSLSFSDMFVSRSPLEWRTRKMNFFMSSKIERCKFAQ